MNYFELFSLPAVFSVDQVRLAQTYRDLQKQFHPDKFVMHDDRTRLQAMQKSTEINDAFQTLKDTCLRAQYLLKLSGLDIQLEQRTLQDTPFLMQQMQWREQLSEFTENDQDDIDNLNAEIAGLVSQLESDIEIALQNEQLEVAANHIRQLKFMLKLQVELELLEDKLFD